MDDEDVIVSIVERELAATPSRVARIDEGVLHETYAIGCDEGEYVLQFSSDADEEREDSLGRGLRWYVALADSEIPVPGVVTETLRSFDGREYSLVERLPGETGERDISPERVRNAGRYLAKIHEFRSFETAGWIRFDDRGASVEAFGEGGPKPWILRRVSDSARMLRDGGLGEPGSELADAFERASADLPATFRPVLCHDDYSPDNVLFRGGAVTGVLDFDRAYAGHGQRDLAKAANCFWMHDPCADWDVRAALYEGYRDATELDDSFERTEPIYRAETLAEIVAGMLELDELSAYERAFYAERLLEAVERVDRT